MNVVKQFMNSKMSSSTEKSVTHHSCRLCSKVTEKYYNALFDSFIRAKVKKYLYIEINERDSYSRFICERCFSRITEFDLYCNEVKKYQQYLENVCQSNAITHDTTIDIEQSEKKAVVSIQSESLNQSDPSIRKQQAKIEKLSENFEGQNQIAIILKNNTTAVETISKKVVTSTKRVNDDPDVSAHYSKKAFANASVDNDDFDQLGNDDECDNNESGDENWNADDTDNGDKLHSIDHVALSAFPTKLIEDAKLIVKGTELIQLLAKFYKLNCEYCHDNRDKLRFGDLPSLLQHYADKHQMKGFVVCCGSKLVKLHAMGMHMARHIQPDAFKCPQCSKILTCPRILQYHIQNHLPEAQRPLTCDQCPRRFSYRGALAAHIISHQPDHERAAYICDECGKEFKTAGRLTNHINVEHIDEGKPNREYSCEVCSKKFSYSCNLAYHMTTHQPYAQQVQCSICGKWLKNKSCLRKHMTQHSSTRFNCTLCAYCTQNQQCLKRHIAVQHSDDKPFQCSDCCKVFKLKTTLTAHMSQHTGDRKFVCEFCNRSFVSNGNYYSHRKRMHQEELAAAKLQRINERRTLSQTLQSPTK